MKIPDGLLKAGFIVADPDHPEFWWGKVSRNREVDVAGYLSKDPSSYKEYLYGLDFDERSWVQGVLPVKFYYVGGLPDD